MESQPETCRVFIDGKTVKIGPRDRLVVDAKGKVRVRHERTRVAIADDPLR